MKVEYTILPEDWKSLGLGFPTERKDKIDQVEGLNVQNEKFKLIDDENFEKIKR